MSDFNSKYRKCGEEQPYIPLGIFKLRIPLIHHRVEVPEAIMPIFLLPIALAAVVPVIEGLQLVELFGGNTVLAFQIAVLMVWLNAALSCLHPVLGCPSYPGWITPGIPLVLVYLSQFATPVERIHAVMAIQLLVAFLFLFLGVTGLAKKIMAHVPTSLRAGILLGAAIAAIQSVIMPGTGRIVGAEISTIIGIGITLIFLYSYHFRAAKAKSKFLFFIGKFGLLIGMVTALIIGSIIGELPRPNIEWGFTPLPFATLVDSVSVFAVGLPHIGFFISAAPLAIALYIIAFGDFITSEGLIKDAEKARGDEIIDFNPNRTNIITGIRNVIMAIFSPFVPMQGPLWSAGVVAVAERYKGGQKQVDAFIGAISTWTIFSAIVLLFAPLVSLMAPALNIGMAVTMLVTGWAAATIGMNLLEAKGTTREDKGIAILVGVTIVFQGAAIGLAVGIITAIVVGTAKKSA